MDSDAIASLTGSDLVYNYKELPERCSDGEIAAYIRRTRDLFDPIARSFDNDKNTEWFIRSYLALKFVLGATVLANSGEYAENRNLQVTLPYLGYYTILNCCRSFLLTLPCLDWRGEKTIQMTHNNILNVTSDKLIRPDKLPPFAGSFKGGNRPGMSLLGGRHGGIRYPGQN